MEPEKWLALLLIKVIMCSQQAQHICITVIQRSTLVQHCINVLYKCFVFAGLAIMTPHPRPLPSTTREIFWMPQSEDTAWQNNLRVRCLILQFITLQRYPVCVSGFDKRLFRRHFLLFNLVWMDESQLSELHDQIRKIITRRGAAICSEKIAGLFILWNCNSTR